ncbi:flagellar export chaperone FliS [Massilia sp. YIM B02443]|uniref:flagellar export chaperone FliS n=1 Tax=Massilia sp. YIM B02443 TaxID=3050127 RepID=UPI0025B67424|nr:flagellar export chaperone FliS [Massilia sp. YIM B02443]MDN4035777.1 flagellar export chaperone FliS [Massilia sp. YIM B02443]
MFGTPKRGVGAYATVGLETGVAAASPHKLVVMLYDGVIVSLLSAINNIKSSNVAAKGAALSKAIAIIDNGLRAALDKSAGGEIAANLDALYDYMSRRLLEANIKNDIAILEEVHGLMADLRGAWVQIGENAEPGMPSSAMQQAPSLMSA